MRRKINRLNMRKGCDEPPGPQPQDYLTKIKGWLEDGRTRSPMPFEVLDWSGVNHVWVCWPLPQKYRRQAGEDEEGTQRDVVVRIGVSDELRLWMAFYSPEDEDRDVALELEVESDPGDTDGYYDYYFNEIGCGEDPSFIHDLDIAEPDSALRLREELARVGIEMYCPVASLRDALAGQP